MISALDFVWRLLVIAAVSSTLIFGAFVLVRAVLQKNAFIFSVSAKAAAAVFLSLLAVSALLMLGFDREWAERCFGLFAQGHDSWGFTRGMALLWIAVAGLWISHDLFRHLRFMRLLQAQTRPETYSVQKPGRPPQDIRLRVHDEALAPFCVGLWPAQVVISSVTLRDGDMAPSAVAHEESHRQHGDGFWNLAALLTLRLAWFQPFVWSYHRSYRLAIELAADRRAVEQFGLDAGAYARTLLSFLESSPAGAVPSRLASMSVLDFDQLEVRFKHLREFEQTPARPWTLRLALVLLVLSGGVGWQQALASMNLSPGIQDVGLCAQVRVERKIEDWLLIETAGKSLNSCEPATAASSPNGRCEQ